MPDAPTPTRAPLLVMAPGDHEYLSDADAFASGRWSRDDVRRLLLAELDAQRAARATAYAEGRREALQDVFTTVATQSTAGMTALDALSWVLSVIAARVDALRDTPAPPPADPRPPAAILTPEQVQAIRRVADRREQERLEAVAEVAVEERP